MNIFIVSFDLSSSNGNNGNSDYQLIDNFLKNSFSYCVKPLYNVYLVVSKQYSAVSIREKIKLIASSIDAIFVAKLEGEYASWNYTDTNKEIEHVFKMAKGVME